MREVHEEEVGSAFPRRPLRAWDLALPLQHVAGAIAIVGRLGDEAEGMLEAPFLALLLEPVDHQLVHLLLLSHPPI